MQPTVLSRLGQSVPVRFSACISYARYIMDIVTHPPNQTDSSETIGKFANHSSRTCRKSVKDVLSFMKDMQNCVDL